MPASRRGGGARPSGQKDIPVADAKARVLELIAEGAKVAEACQAVGRSMETYRDWQKDDAEFKEALAAIRSHRAETKDTGRPPVPDFPEFCRDYLGEPLFEHQMRAWDVLSGREPRSPHPALQYDKGDEGRLILNFPPNHAKTNTFAINYITWLIHKNPSISIAVISKTQNYAKKILAGVKARLTSKTYRDMHLKFAPEGGWRDPDQSWTQTLIYVQGKYEGEAEKEPTVEAIGIGGQIYGGRFHTIIMDDVVDNTNVNMHENQVNWVLTMLMSRLPPSGGTLLALGTRLAPTDIYGELRALRDEDDRQYFTYFAQPAVLEYAEGDSEWDVLWPYSLGDESEEDATLRCLHCFTPAADCSCDAPDHRWHRIRWNRKRLRRQRAGMTERMWSLVWQQQQIPDDATFNQWAVQASVNGARQAGPLRVGAMGHPENGRNGLYVVGGLDPATVGNTAMIVSGLDRLNEKRYIIDGFNQAGTSPATMRDAVMRLTDLHKINEWVIERNAFQRFLTQDPGLNTFLRSRGCKLTEHYTNENKVDPDFGVMSLAPLFESCGKPQEGGRGGKWTRTPDTALIELPASKDSKWVPELIKQLITWEPSGLSQTQKTDLVMALWFTEIAFQRILGRNRKIRSHMDNPFASGDRLRDRQVVNLAEIRQARFEGTG